MTIDLTQVILAVITLISGLLTSFLIPYLKQRLSAVQQDRLAALIRVGVFAAQQLYQSGEGTKKKAYVIQLLEQQGYAINSAEIDAQIEAELMNLKLAAGWTEHSPDSAD